MTTRGDIIYRDNTNTTARLGLGALNQLLSSDGSDLVWRNDTAFLQWVTAPATKTSAGIAGQIAYSSNYLYICTKTGTEGNAAWKRIAMVTNW